MKLFFRCFTVGFCRCFWCLPGGSGASFIRIERLNFGEWVGGVGTVEWELVTVQNPQHQPNPLTPSSKCGAA